MSQLSIETRVPVTPMRSLAVKQTGQPRKQKFSANQVRAKTPSGYFNSRGGNTSKSKTSIVQELQRIKVRMRK